MSFTRSDSDDDVYCASEDAIKAATMAYHFRGGSPTPAALSDALIAAHHPNLGLDRSVCLRDVVEMLREKWRTDPYASGFKSAIALIEREFGDIAT